MGKLIAVLALLLALGVGGALAWNWWVSAHQAHQLAGALQARGEAVVATGQVKADAAAERITTRGAAREHAIADIGEANHAAITAAPGSDDPMGPELMDAARRGLCRYAAYRDDPECARLHAADSAQLPPAGQPAAVAGDVGDQGRGPEQPF